MVCCKDISLRLHPLSIFLDEEAASKKAMLQRIADILAGKTGLSGGYIHSALEQREYLAPTAIGAGTALPHAQLDQLPEPCLIYIHLRRPIAFDAEDRAPVDRLAVLIFCRQSRHPAFAALRHMASRLRDPETTRMLKRLRDPIRIAELLNMRDRSSA